jgi:hypothetical protein
MLGITWVGLMLQYVYILTVIQQPIGSDTFVFMNVNSATIIRYKVQIAESARSCKRVRTKYVYTNWLPITNDIIFSCDCPDGR